MKADSFIEDPELGRLLIRTDGRVRRLTFRTKAEGIYVTLPPGTPRQELLRAIEQLRPRLAEARRKMSVPHFDLNYRIDAECLRLSLVNGEDEKRFLIRSQPGIVEIACPPSTDFHNGDLQAWLRKVVVEALRKQRGINQEQLADALEVSRQTIGSLENGRYNPSILLAFKISRYFGLPIEEIFIYEEE